MIIDFRSKDPVVKACAFLHFGERCFLDGKEILMVYYVDTEAGIVKSYDVLGDGKVVHQLHERAEWPSDVEDIGNGLMGITLRGKVQILAPLKFADGGEIPAGTPYIVGQ